MRRNVAHPPAPRVAAASSCSVPISRRTGSTSRTTNGSVTNTVASTIPGRPKMTRNPSDSIPPNHPPYPHSRTRETPTTTGETANGRSMIACTMPRPGNRPRTRAIAVAMPKITLSGTTITTISRLSCNALIAAGVVIQSQNCAMPCSKDRQKIRATGTTRSTNR